MKTITKEQAIPGVWNFIERGEFPEHTANVLLTIHWNNQEFVVMATYNNSLGRPLFLDENGVDYDHVEAISWQYPPAPSKRTHKEEWMSQWEPDNEFLRCGPDEYEVWRLYNDSAQRTYYGCVNGVIGEANTMEEAMEFCYKHFITTNP